MLTTRSILRYSLRFNIVTIFLKIIAFPTSIIIARYLGPDKFGFVGYVTLWYSYGVLLSLGTVNVSVREIPTIADEEKEKENEIIKRQNTSIILDFLFKIFISILVLLSGFLFNDKSYHLGFVIICASILVTGVQSYYEGFLLARKYFSLVATSRFISGLLYSISAISLVFIINEYALLVAPIISSICSTIYLSFKKTINFKIEIIKKDINNLLKTGAQLQLLTIVNKLFRLSDNTIIIAFFNTYSIGIYSFAAGNINKVLEFFIDFGRVLQPEIYGQDHKSNKVFYPNLRNVIIQVAFLSALMTILTQLFFIVIVTLFLPNFLDSIPVFIILSFKIFLSSLTLFPNLVLTSSHVNMQNQSTKSYVIALIIITILGISFYFLNLGIIGISIALLIGIFITDLRQFFFAKEFIFSNKQDLIDFLKDIFVIGSIVLGTSFFIFLSGELINILIIFPIYMIIWSIYIWICLKKENSVGLFLKETFKEGAWRKLIKK